MEWLVNNIADEAMGSIKPGKSLSENLEQLNQDHGYAFLNPEKHEEYILELVDFPISKNPARVFSWIERQLDILVSCGGNVTNSLKRKIVMKGLGKGINQKSVFVQNDFWFQCRGYLNMNPMEYEQVKKYCWKFWDSHRNPHQPIDETPFSPSKPQTQSNQVSGKRERPTCEYCQKYRKAISRTHSTEKCFYGDKPGRERVVSNDSSALNSAEYNSTPSSSSYFLTFHDTGCTPTSFFADKPINFVPKQGLVHTADKNQPPIQTLGH